MNFYKRVVRPLLFKFSPERAHALALKALSRPGWLSPFSDYFNLHDDRLGLNLGGLKLNNPVGLAAGFDKDAEVTTAMACLGFGYVVVGSILPQARKGHPHPIYLRLQESCSLMNCAGLPSKGLEYSLARLAEVDRPRTAIIANIEAFTLEEYLDCYQRLEPLVDGVEVGLGCPNVYQAKAEQELNFFGQLLEEITRIKKKPVFVKFPALHRADVPQRRRELIASFRESGVDGVTITGSRPRVPDARLSMKAGTLSGKAVFDRTIENVREAYLASGGILPIKAAGGIFSGADAFKAIAAGASAVELYTALVYEGPAIARRINKELLSLLESHEIKSVEELRGMAASEMLAPL